MNNCIGKCPGDKQVVGENNIYMNLVHQINHSGIQKIMNVEHVHQINHIHMNIIVLLIVPNKD